MHLRKSNSAGVTQTSNTICNTSKLDLVHSGGRKGKFMFLVVVVIVMATLHGYVGFRFISPFNLTGFEVIVFWTIIAILAIAPIGLLLLRFRGIENNFTDLLLWVGYTSLGLFSLAFVIFLVRDLGWIISTGANKLFVFVQQNETGSTPVDLERRQFLLVSINWAIFGMTGILGTVGIVQALRQAEIIRHTISLKKLPLALNGLKIVQISDLHVGPTIKADYVKRVVNQVNEIEPDLILFTGDMVDGSVEYLSKDVEPLRQLRSKYGKFFVTGNHEYYSGVEHWLPKVEDLGFVHLMNEHQILEINGEFLALAGVTDLSAHQVMKSHRSDPKQAVSSIPDGMSTILMAHQPGTIRQIDGLAIDLMVCGHTHGGQFMPFNLAVAKAEPLVAGLYQHNDTQVYVNRGTGYWGPPMRLGIPSEITLFELVSGSRAASA